jgi:hypothetical protein
MTTPVVEQAKSPRKRPADYTGKLSEQLNAEKKIEKQDAATRIAMVTAAASEAKNDVIDYTDSSDPVREVVPQQVEVNTPYRMIRVNSRIDQMTYGREVLDPGDYSANPPRPAIMGPMKYYTFEEGQLYKVPSDVAEHLQDIGYISYMGGV